MEKLNSRLLALIVGTALVSFASPVFAGPGGYRLSSKSIIPKGPATATPFRGYVFGYGGVSFGSTWNTTGAFDLSDPDWMENCPEDWHTDPAFDPQNIAMDWETETGWTAGGGIGRYSGLFGGSRFELEGTYLTNGVDGIQYAGFELPADFDIETKAFMVNYLKEIPLGRLTGYVGGGIGYAWSEMNGDIDTIKYSDSDGGFAWQFIAGLDIPVTERLALFTQYRYLVLSDMAFTTDFGDFTNTTNDNPANHSVLFGARVSF